MLQPVLSHMVFATAFTDERKCELGVIRNVAYHTCFFIYSRDDGVVVCAARVY